MEQSPARLYASHGRLSRFDDGGMTGYGTVPVSVMVMVTN